MIRPLYLLILAFSQSVFAQSLENKVTQIFSKNCEKCHGSDGKEKGSLKDITDLASVVEQGAVTPGDPSRSSIFDRIESGEMPPGKLKKLTKAEVETVKTWITSLKPAGPKRKRITAKTIEEEVLKDIETIARKDAKLLATTRYISFDVQYLLTDDETLSLYSKALDVILNSVSSEKELTSMKPVGKTGVLFSINLKSYGIDTLVWDKIFETLDFPEFDGPGFQLTHTEEIKKKLSSKAAVLRAGTVALQLTSDEQYRKLVKIPASATVHFKDLNIDPAKNFEATLKGKGEILRAGFAVSGVSSSNRVIERHQLRNKQGKPIDGGFWRSFDFSSKRAGNSKNIFSGPLAPYRAGFVADGGEYIFNLPNGLQAYYISNNSGFVVKSAPEDIVFDRSRTPGTITSPHSCMGCHALGLLLKGDEVRDVISKDPQASEAFVNEVKELYPPAKTFAAALNSDSALHLAALKKLKVPVDPKIDYTEFLMSVRFPPVTLKEAAAELCLEVDDLKKYLSLLPQEVGVTYRALIAGSMDRSDFLEHYFELTDAVGELRKNVKEEI